MKKEGTPIYGSPNSRLARAAASPVRWAQLNKTELRVIIIILVFVLSILAYKGYGQNSMYPDSSVYLLDNMQSGSALSIKIIAIGCYHSGTMILNISRTDSGYYGFFDNSVKVWNASSSFNYRPSVYIDSIRLNAFRGFLLNLKHMTRENTSTENEICYIFFNGNPIAFYWDGSGEFKAQKKLMRSLFLKED